MGKRAGIEKVHWLKVRALFVAGPHSVLVPEIEDMGTWVSPSDDMGGTISWLGVVDSI